MEIFTLKNCLQFRDGVHYVNLHEFYFRGWQEVDVGQIESTACLLPTSMDGTGDMSKKVQYLRVAHLPYNLDRCNIGEDLRCEREQCTQLPPLFFQVECIPSDGLDIFKDRHVGSRACLPLFKPRVIAVCNSASCVLRVHM